MTAAVKRVILHIGRHKSGTSAIQMALGTNRDALAAQGVLYPRLPDPDDNGRNPGIAHHALARALDPRKDRALLGPLAKAVRRAVKRQPDAHTLLLSSEAFQNIRRPGRLKKFIAGFQPEEVQIVCYAREHLDYALSGYRQMIQAQDRFLPFSRFAARHGDMAPFLEFWDGIGRLDLAWYDDALAATGDITDDFLARTGIALPARPAARRNPSIGGNLLWLRLLANRDHLPFPGYNVMSDLAAAVPGFRQPFRVPADLADSLRGHSGYNRSLAERLGAPRLKSWDDLPDLPDTGSLGVDMIRLRDLAAAATRRGKPGPDLGWLDAHADGAAGRFYL